MITPYSSPSSKHLHTQEVTTSHTRIVTHMTAMQVSDKISTIVHLGNPYPLEELPHIPRVIIGGISTDSVNVGLDALAGENEAKGVLTYNIKLQ